MLQNATPLRKWAPGPANISDEHVSCTAPAAENASLQILFKCPTPAIVLEMLQNPHVWSFLTRCTIPCAWNDIWTSKSAPYPSVFCALLTWKCASRHNGMNFFNMSTSKSADGVFCRFWLGHVLRATMACTFSTCQLPKVLRRWCALQVLTWKCASRHNGVHFFDISTSKSAPTLMCFVRFDLEMCFAPQRCALFHHLNFQKWFKLFFWLRNLIRATTACNFHLSSSQMAPRPPL